MQIKEYLIHSYLYYVMNESVISDAEYDTLCRQLEANFATYQSIWKKYISLNDLKAGTGYNLFVDESGYKYPKEIIEAAETRLAEHRAQRVLGYRVTTNDPEMLYLSLRLAEDWFLTGLYSDYAYFLKPDPHKRKMALGVIERIWKERKEDNEGKDEVSA